MASAEGSTLQARTATIGSAFGRNVASSQRWSETSRDPGTCRLKSSPLCGIARMDNWTFGLTLTIVAGGGTFLTLWVLGLIIDLLKRIYPLTPTKPGHE
jgi:hypothetical protein